jgi:ferritin-like protein
VNGLKGALQLAMQLEFATLPPYLCAEWSADANNDPDQVGNMIGGIALQEMFHFALAGNMLAAIGGSPSVATADFIPKYPTNELPGGIPQKLPVDLKPLSNDQLEVFLQIEFPEFPQWPLHLQSDRPRSAHSTTRSLPASRW